MLTQQQLNHFETFGFIVWQQAFSPDEMATITAQFEDVLAEDRQGQEFKGDKRQGVHGFLEMRDDLRKLLEDDRIFGAVEQLLGPGFVWIGSDGNLYVGDTRWHPDNSAQYARVKVAFYLDPVGAQTGCLRVIPGSHLPGLGDRLREAWPIDETGESPFGIGGSLIPYFPLESVPGDVVFFDQRVFHSSYGGKTGRRMFTLNFGAKPTSRADYDNLCRTYQNNIKNQHEMGYTKRDRIYTDDFLYSDSPRIQAMVGELVQLGFR
jgi:ectoine hydroxylase-related dioxygenase (phytanoyl-CoA dioxygenase family)